MSYEKVHTIHTKNNFFSKKKGQVIYTGYLAKNVTIRDSQIFFHF